MDDEESRVALIRELYQKIGGNPDDIYIGPSEEFFGINYRVTRGDKKETLNRRDLDDRNFIPIQAKLGKLL